MIENFEHPLQSPQNENISNIGRRLSAVPGQKWLIPERGDRLPIRKSPPLAGISAITKDGFPESRTAWLGRELPHYVRNGNKIN